MEAFDKPLTRGTHTVVAVARHPLHPMVIPFPIAFLWPHGQRMRRFGISRIPFGRGPAYGYWVPDSSWVCWLL